MRRGDARSESSWSVHRATHGRSGTWAIDLRAEGLYDEALAVYVRLDQAMPDDPAVALRLALAHAGAGGSTSPRGLLNRVAQTGGRGDDGRLGELASVVSAVLLAGGRQASPAPETDALLVRRLAQTPLPDVASLILVRTPVPDDPVEVLSRSTEKDKNEESADLDAVGDGALGGPNRARRGGRAHPVAAIGGAFGGPLDARHGHRTRSFLSEEDDPAKIVVREVDVMPGGPGVSFDGTGGALTSQDESGARPDEKPASRETPEAEDPELWEAETPDGVVRKVTLEPSSTTPSLQAAWTGRPACAHAALRNGPRSSSSSRSLLPCKRVGRAPCATLASVRWRAPSLRPPEVHGRRPRPVMGPAHLCSVSCSGRSW